MTDDADASAGAANSVNRSAKKTTGHRPFAALVQKSAYFGVVIGDFGAKITPGTRPLECFCRMNCTTNSVRKIKLELILPHRIYKWMRLPHSRLDIGLKIDSEQPKV